MAVLLRRFLAWVAWAMPVLGAVAGRAFVGGAGHWSLKAAMGFLVGLSMSFLVWQSRTVPPYSTWLGIGFAAAFGLSALVGAMFASDSGLGVLLAIIVSAGVLGWAATR
jgi:hypothetical protein